MSKFLQKHGNKHILMFYTLVLCQICLKNHGKTFELGSLSHRSLDLVYFPVSYRYCSLANRTCICKKYFETKICREIKYYYDL